MKTIPMKQSCKQLLSGLVVAGLGAFLWGERPAIAAERLVITFGLAGRSIAIEDLRTVADTGEVPRSLRWYMNVANLDGETLQQVLTQEIHAPLLKVDRITNSIPGEFALFQLGNLIHTGSGQANVQALRSALVLSAVEDDKISLIEVLENYPTPGIYIDGRVLLQVARDVRRVRQDLEPIVAVVEAVIDSLDCACGEVPAVPATPISLMEPLMHPEEVTP